MGRKRETSRFVFFSFDCIEHAVSRVIHIFTAAGSCFFLITELYYQNRTQYLFTEIIWTDGLSSDVCLLRI